MDEPKRRNATLVCALPQSSLLTFENSYREPAVEFIVQEDRTVVIQLLDENRNPVTPTNQVITLIGGERTSPTSLAFAKKGNRLVSDQPILEGASIPVVLQIMASANAAVVREKFNINLSECPTCDYQEYACVCGHDNH